MIGYRSGPAPLTHCDRCWRPQRTGEDGWTKVTVQRPYRTIDEVVLNATASVFVGVEEDRCPDCMEETT